MRLLRIRKNIMFIKLLIYKDKIVNFNIKFINKDMIIKKIKLKSQL